jgi:hypothetical protein
MIAVQCDATLLLRANWQAEHMLGNGVDLRHNQWKELLIGCIQSAIDDELARDVTTFLANSHIDINHQVKARGRAASAKLIALTFAPPWMLPASEGLLHSVACGVHTRVPQDGGQAYRPGC